MKLPAHNRYDFVPIDRRPDYSWPNGARLAVTICNNIEHFAFNAGMGSDSATGTAPQNQRNYAWRDYGNRVGIWNLLDLLEEFELPASHNVNSAALEYCPEIVERLNKRGDEYVGHGRTNAERQDIMREEDEARLIAEMIVDQFDEMLLQARKRTLVYGISLHPFIIGQPFRLHALRGALGHILEHRKELWITTPGEIARYCSGLPNGVVPGS